MGVSCGGFFHRVGTLGAAGAPLGLILTEYPAFGIVGDVLCDQLQRKNIAKLFLGRFARVLGRHRLCHTIRGIHMIAVRSPRSRTGVAAPVTSAMGEGGIGETRGGDGVLFTSFVGR